MIASRRVPRLLAISDRPRLPDAPDTDASSDRWAAWLRGLLDDQVEALLIREKALDDLDQLALAQATHAAQEQGRAPATVLVSGRADLAIASGLAGVHLPASEIPASLIRATLGERLLLGRSTHHPDEVAAARDDGVDYVTFGPVFATPSKARYGEPPGLNGLERATRHGLPVLALGGITPERVRSTAEAGAHGVAAIRSFVDPDTRRRLVAAAHAAW